MQNKTLQMKRVLHTALLVLMLNAAGKEKGYAQDFDFAAVCETGQTLYYNIIDSTNHYIELTCPGDSYSYNYWTNFVEPTGNIILPESVHYNDVTYIVTTNRRICFL